MVLPAAVAGVAGHALCGVVAQTTCDECQNCFDFDSNATSNQTQPQHQDTSSKNPIPIDDSTRTFQQANKPAIPTKPKTSLGANRQESVALFAHPIVTRVETNEDASENDVEQNSPQKLKTSIHHQKDGDDSVVEVDYEGGDSTVASNQVVSGKSEFFIDGNFHYGKVRDIETQHFCYNIKFNLDSTILAIGMNNTGGVLLYETKTFSLLHTIERDDTVSALDWADNPFPDNDEEGTTHDDERSQLLAVGGFDGVVTIYSVVKGSRTKDLVTAIYDVRVKTDVMSMAFVKDNATNYAPHPLALVIGEMDGTVSLLLTDGELNQFASKSKMTKIDEHQNEVLAVAFGFVEDGIIMATGTKYGLVRVSALVLHNGEWKVSDLLFEYLRTGAIRALRFNHDSTSLIVGGYDKTVLLVDTYLWKVVHEIHVDGTVNTIEFDPFHRYLLLGTRSKILTVIDTSTHHPIKTFQTLGWVTCVTWGGDSMIAMRSDDKTVSLIKFEPIQSLGLILESSRGEECSMSWSYDGRFLARTHKNEVIINDSKKEFEEVSRLGQNDSVRDVKFCYAEGKRERLAIVGNDGFVRLFQLRISVGRIHVEPLASIFLEPNLWSVCWSTDGETIIAGGKGEMLHFICTKTYKPLHEPMKTGGRVKTIDSLSQAAQSDLGDFSTSIGLAITVGQNMAQIFDMNTYESSMEITRKRTVRCLRYHPTLPILAVGDGSNEIVIVDLVAERRVASFSVGGRVNSIDFSPAGDFMAVGSDACTFTIHETTSFKVVQEIPAKGFAMSVAFSGTSGQYLAIAHADGETDIIHLGPLLSIDCISPGVGVHELPEWALHEAIYRSPQGPPFLQRCMFEGSKESLVCAAKILKEFPNAVLTFDRTSGVGCFEFAVQLRKPNIMQLIMTTLVDGTLDSQNELSSSLLTTSMPIDGFLTLRDLILHHPPGFATDILRSMTFIKVPFVVPIKVRSEDIKECGSSHYTNPWDDKLRSINQQEAYQIDPKDQEILVPAVLPLPGLGTLDFLSVLIENTGPDVFDNDAMGLVLVVMWNAGVRNYFLIDFVLNIAFYILWVLFVDRSSSNTASVEHAVWAVTFLAWAVFLANIAFTVEQSIRLTRRQGKLFRSSWHQVDLACIILVYAYTILVILNDTSDNSYFHVSNYGPGNVPLGVISTLALTARFISLLRGFDRTGWLVSVLTQNFLDVRGFIVVIISILVGFTIAFRLLFADVKGECIVALEDSNNGLISECEGDPFGDIPRSLLSTFELTILGSYENSLLFDSNQSVLAAIVFITAVTVVLVVALNALIAVLGDSFSRVQENVTANRRRERAELIVEYLSMMPVRQRKQIEQSNQYFHALLASDGHGDLLVHKDDWQGGLNALKRELTEMTVSNSEMTHQAINQLREELKAEISGMMRNEITTILNDIFVEVKEISKSQRTGPLPPSKKVVSAVQAINGKFQKNFHPFDGIQRNFGALHTPMNDMTRTLLRPIRQLDNSVRGVLNINDTREENVDNNNINAETNEDDEFDEEDYPNLMSSATFG